MTKKFVCLMDDGSIFRMPSPYWDKALSIKYPVGRWSEIKKIFRQTVAKHWQEKTVPTKFDEDEPWEEEYKSHADLGRDVMYPYIRAPLMGLALAEKTGGKVVALQKGKGKVVIYSDKKPKEMTIKEALVSNLT